MSGSQTPNPWVWSHEHQEYYRTEWVPNPGHNTGYHLAHIFYQKQSNFPAFSPVSNIPRHIPVQLSNDSRAGGNGGNGSQRSVPGYGAGPSAQLSPSSSSASQLGLSSPLAPGGYDASVTSESGSLIQGTPNATFEPLLDPSYRLVDKEWAFFVRGRVFQMLLIDNASEKIPMGSANVSLVQYGEKAYVRISRFVVVEPRADRHYSKCIPISTYSGRATTHKNSGEQKEHGIIHSGDGPPQRLHGEVNLRKDPIRVDVIDPSLKLSTDSRINYAFTRPIQHNVKVKNVGMIAKNDMFKLVSYWREYR